MQSITSPTVRNRATAPAGGSYFASFANSLNENNQTVTQTLGGRPPQYAPIPVTLTLKVVSESRVTWATSVPIVVFLGLSGLDLGPMYATDRRQTASSLNGPRLGGGA